MTEAIEQTLPARVLLVEDDETTRHLYSAMLERAGFVVVEAENLNQAAGLLDDSIDIALLDIMLKGQSGLDILKYIQLNFPSCPVIMISASTDKGNVIEALNEGAVAYLQKPVDPRELFYTVRHWVDFCRMKEGSGRDQHYRTMCAALKENAASYRQLIEHMPAAVVVHDRSGKILYANPAAAGMLRANDASALMGRHVLEFVQPESLVAVKELKQQVEAGKPCSIEKLHFLRCDGTPFLTEMKAVPACFEQQQAVQVILLDVTERRRAEEAMKASEARLEEAQAIACVGNWEWNTQTNEVFFSAEACRIFGFDRERAGVQFQAVFDLIHPDDQGRVRQGIDAMLQHHAPLDIQHRIVLAGGGERIVNERGIVHLDAEGQVVRVTGTIQDVTEQKRYEVTLQEQLDRNEQILQTTQDGFWMVSRDGRLVEVNDTYCCISGYSREELLNINIADVEANESPEEMAAHMATVLERGYDCFETRHRCKDGSLIDLEISVSVIKQGEARLFAAFLRDISERRQQEAQLREHLKQHELIVQTTRDGFWIAALDGRLVEVNDTYCRMSGYASDELLGMTIGHLEANEDPDEIKAHVARVMGQGYDCFETRHRCKDGSLVDVEISVSLIEQGQEKLLVAFLRDISERKQSEMALQESKAQLQALIEQAPEGIFIADIEGRYSDVNTAGCRMLGFERHEIIGKTILDFIPPEEVERLGQSRQELMQGKAHVAEWSLRCKDGSYLPVEVSARILPDGRWQGFVRDISERRQAEQQLRQSMHALGERMKELRCLYGLSKLSGLATGSVADYLQQAVQLLPPGWQYPENTCARIFFGGREFSTDNFRSSGCCLSRPIIIQEKEVGRVEVCYLDEMPEADQGPFLSEELDLIEAIADHLGRSIQQIRTERELRESEDRFRSAFDSAVTGMAMVGLDGSFRQVNDSLCAMVGYTQEELLGKSFQGITHPDDLPADFKLIEQLTAGEIPHYQLEKRYLHKLGHNVWVRIKVSIVRNALGEGQYFVVQIEDVTERRQAEESARLHREKLERFNKMAVGRELTMIELKKEINGLLAELGRSDKYIIHKAGRSDENVGR